MAPAPSALGQQAPAPGPAASAPKADILFAVSATRAVLTASALELTHVAPEVLFLRHQRRRGRLHHRCGAGRPRVHLAVS